MTDQDMIKAYLARNPEPLFKKAAPLKRTSEPTSYPTYGTKMDRAHSHEAKRAAQSQPARAAKNQRKLDRRQQMSETAVTAQTLGRKNSDITG